MNVKLEIELLARSRNLFSREFGVGHVELEADGGASPSNELSDIAIFPMFGPFEAETAKSPTRSQKLARRAVRTLARQFRNF